MLECSQLVLLLCTLSRTTIPRKTSLLELVTTCNRQSYCRFSHNCVTQKCTCIVKSSCCRLAKARSRRWTPGSAQWSVNAKSIALASITSSLTSDVQTPYKTALFKQLRCARKQRWKQDEASSACFDLDAKEPVTLPCPMRRNCRNLVDQSVFTLWQVDSVASVRCAHSHHEASRKMYTS